VDTAASSPAGGNTIEDNPQSTSRSQDHELECSPELRVLEARRPADPARPSECLGLAWTVLVCGANGYEVLIRVLSRGLNLQGSRSHSAHLSRNARCSRLCLGLMEAAESCLTGAQHHQLGRD
jgi:hypothetical protein